MAGSTVSQYAQQCERCGVDNGRVGFIRDVLALVSDVETVDATVVLLYLAGY